MPQEHPIRELRNALGLKQREFAEQVGLSAAYVSQVENGVLDLGKEAGFKIMDRYRTEALRLGITLEDMLRGSREGAAA